MVENPPLPPTILSGQKLSVNATVDIQVGDLRSTYSTEGLSWDRPLPAELVHRFDAGQIFATSLSHPGPDEFLVGARWPADHAFYQVDAGGRHDPMLIAETMRQAGIAAAHAGYQVTFGTQFIMRDVGFSVTDPAALQTRSQPHDVVVSLVCSDILRKGGMLREVRFQVTLLLGGQAFAHGSGFLVCAPPEVFQRLSRTQGIPATPAAARPPLDPSLVGRGLAADVLLRPSGGPPQDASSGSWHVQADPSHPALFEHPLDHLPGMLQLETFRQAALALTAGQGPADPRRFVGCEARFLRIVDLQAPVVCRARLVSPVVAVELAPEDGPPCTTGVVYLAPEG